MHGNRIETGPVMRHIFIGPADDILHPGKLQRT